MLEFSNLESKRFQKKIFRGKLREINNEKLLAFLIDNNVDVAIIRIPASRIIEFYKLNDLKIPYIIADMLIYFYNNINRYTPENLRNHNMDFIECTESYKSILVELVKETFFEYKNHYLSNPLFKPNDIIDGYIEWTCNYISSHDLGKICWLIKIKEEFVGFATCLFDMEKKKAEISLIGVSRKTFLKYKTLGAYNDIIRFIQYYFKKRGFLKIITSTQAHNLSVQRVLNTEGFIVLNTFNTIHINSLFSYSDLPTYKVKFKISNDDLKKFNELYKTYFSKKNIKDIQFNSQGVYYYFILNYFFYHYVKHVNKITQIEILSIQSKILNQIKHNEELLISANFISKYQRDNYYTVSLRIKNNKDQILIYYYIDLILHY